MARPNVLLILADDMGFSDIGCYGGEIHTPNIDRLAAGGVRLSQFYNTARCSPSRASMLTGLHPHQTGIGILTNDDRPRGYPGTLNERCVTVAEVLKNAGYATCLAGKWHLASEMHEPNDAWPTRRGFDHFFGTLTGCGSFYQPGTLTRGEVNIDDEALKPEFFYTDAIATEAEAFILDASAREQGQPFFLYTAFTAPHWPLHAHVEDIARYSGAFDAGWDVLREQRMARQRSLGILGEEAKLSERDPTQPTWENAEHKAWQARRMEAYAAQIDRMDQGIGRILAALETQGALDDTMVIFLSDNGACAEALPQGDLERFKRRSDILRVKTRDGREVRIGNEPSIMPGAEDTYASYGRAWANLSNTPFRFYKRWVHEGGIATPLIVHWPNGQLKSGSVAREPFQLVDVLPTILEAAGARYPQRYGERSITPQEGRSFLPVLRGARVPETMLFWEHIGNCAVRHGRWKLVREQERAWELYDLAEDRSELRNRAEENPALVSELASAWEAWATRVGVIPWPTVVELYAERGVPLRDAAG